MNKVIKISVRLLLGLGVLGMLAAAGAYEGYEPLTSGGEGGGEIWVTNLNDSGTGSFRAALAGLDGSATIIKFSVGGTINLSSALKLTDPNVTIAGETAPGYGITVNGGDQTRTFEINTHDVIVRHLRFRDSSLEGIQVWGDYDIIIDHCSVTGTADGAIDINGGTHHITLSRNLFADDVEVHRCYGIDCSIHHNLYTYNNRRQPKIYKAGPRYDFRNNIVEYWTNTGTNIQNSDDGVNIINNYYGPPAPGESWDAGFNIGGGCNNIYTDGNYDPGEDIDSQGDLSQPVTEPNVTTIAATLLPDDVKPDCGALPRDAFDEGYAGPAGAELTADAGDDQFVYVNDVVTFDGSGSTGDITSYDWEFGDGATASGCTVTHSYTATNVYTVTLTVSDGSSSDDDTCTVTVTEEGALVANAGADQEVYVDEQVTFDGSGSTGDITSYEWEFGDGGTASGCTVTHIYTTPNDYTATLTVSDGEQSDDDTCIITVDPQPSNPTVSYGAGTVDGWNLEVSDVVLQTIYGTQQDENGTIIANSYRYLSIDKGLALAFAVPSNAYLDTATFKCRAVKTSNDIRIRFYDVTDMGYLDYGHSMSRANPGGSGNDPIFNIVSTTPNPVPSHDENGFAYTDMTLDFDSLYVSAGEYLLVFDAEGPNNTWGNFVRGTVDEAEGMGEYPDGSPLPSQATVTTVSAEGNTYYYLLKSITETDYTAYSRLFAFQMIETAAGNHAPVADAGSDQQVDVDEVVTFDGSGSYDPDEDPLTYTWNFGDGSTASGCTVSHSYTATGSYTVTLTVDDGELSDDDICTVTVEAGNTAPIADAGSDQQADVDEVVTFDGSGSYDPDEDPLTYTWNFGDGSTASGCTVTHSYSTADSYTVTLTVDDGELSDDDTCTVTVQAGNTAPIADAGSDQQADVDEVVTFDGSGSYDPEEDPLTYTWNFGDGSTASGCTVTHSYTATGSYTVTLTVDDGELSDDDTCIITVQEGVNNPPVADAGPNQQAAIDEVVTFDGSGSYDPDEDPLTYTWQFGDGETGIGCTVTHSYSSKSNYVITLTVDDGALSDDDTCRCNVK